MCMWRTHGRRTSRESALPALPASACSPCAHPDAGRLVRLRSRVDAFIPCKRVGGRLTEGPSGETRTPRAASGAFAVKEESNPAWEAAGRDESGMSPVESNLDRRVRGPDASRSASPSGPPGSLGSGSAGVQRAQAKRRLRALRAEPVVRSWRLTLDARRRRSASCSISCCRSLMAVAS